MAASVALISIGAVLNAAGALAPAAARLLDPAEPAAPRALLALAVYADAAFNLLLGIGLVLANVALWREGAPAWFAVLGIAAGVASVPWRVRPCPISRRAGSR